MADEDVYPTLDLALRIGELLLSSGAGAADVSAQMQNVTIACGLRGAAADITFTSLQLTYQESQDTPALIQVRTVRHREIDYEDLTLVDQLVRDLLAGSVDRHEARVRLNRIVSSGHARRRGLITLGWGVLGLGVGLLLGANPVVTLAAAVAAMGIDLVQRELNRRRLPSFYQQVAGGMLATLLAVGVNALDLGVDPSRIVTAGIIMLLAGVSFMGAIQDALTGYPLTAGARILEAVLATAGVVSGVSGGLTLAAGVGLDLPHIVPGASAYASTPVMILGGAISAAAFAYASYAPYRALLPSAVIGGLATAVFSVGYAGGFGVAWPSTVAAIVVGLVSFGAAGRVRVPTLAIVVSGVVPLLPGLSIYRGLARLSEGDGNGLVGLVNAAVIAIGLAAGVIFGEYIAQPLGREARRLENRLSGPRLVGPFSARSVRRRHGRQSASSRKGSGGS